MVFSTGLLVLEPTQITKSKVPFLVRTGFNGSNFDLSNVGSTAAQQAYGVQSGKLSYPSDMAENLGVQSFDQPSGLPFTTYAAEVQGFSTSLDCEILQLGNATLTFLPWLTSKPLFPNATTGTVDFFNTTTPYFSVNITTDSCYIKNAIVGQGVDVIVGYEFDHGSSRNGTVTENYQGRFQNFTCNTDGDNSVLDPVIGKPLSGHPLNGNNSMDHRFLLSMAFLQWVSHQVDTDPPSNWPMVEYSTISLNQLTGVLCKPSYSIDNYSISYTHSQDTPRTRALQIPSTNSTLKEFDDSMLIEAVQASFENATFGEGAGDYIVTPDPTFFQVMKAVHTVPNLKPFMDPILLQELGSRIFKSASASIAHQNLMTSQYSSANGSFTFTEDRLQVKRLTVGLMATCLGLLVCVSILEIFVRPWNTVSCEPKSISALSTILAASRSLKRRLISTGSTSSDVLQHQLSQDKFQTVILQHETNSFVLELVSDSTEMARPLPPSSVDASTEWWRPMAVRGWFTVMITVLPLCLIVLLEVLQHVSDSRDGVVDVTDSNVDSQILSTYLPALVTLVLGMLYTSFDFTISIFAPLAALRRGNVSAARSVMAASVGGLPPFALFQSLRNWHFAQCLTIIAAFVSSLPGIVVSALYTVQTVSKNQTVSLQQADFFNWTHVDLSRDDEFAGSATNLLTYENMPYPQWTYNNLVLPSLTASSADISAPINGSESIVVKVPAIRGSLSNCSAVPSKSINITTMGSSLGCEDCDDSVRLNYSMALPYSLCGSDSENHTATWIQEFTAPNDSSIVYIGKGTALQWHREEIDGKGTALQWNHDEIDGNGVVIPRVARSGSYQIDNSIPSCPSFSYSLGMANVGTKIGNSTYNPLGIISNSTKTKVLRNSAWSFKQNITIVYCYQRLEQVMTNVTFSYPDFMINNTAPPIPFEETATVITQNNTQHWFDISMNAFLSSLQSLPLSIIGRNDVDSFIQALTWGHSGVPLDELYSNGDISTLTAAANRLYGQYIAQAISANMRTTIPPKSTIYNVNQQQSNYTAILLQTAKRLQQNRGPKIALQAMLGFLTVCAMATHFMVDTKKVVPHNPCSIAGMMSLLAESEMCKTREVIPEGAEWKCEKELKKDGVFTGFMFQMGWSETDEDTLGEGGERRRVFGIDIIRKSDGEEK